MPQHWVILDIVPHGAHPVSHSDALTLRAYFDEAPGDRSDRTGTGGADHYSVPVEHGLQVPAGQRGRLHHPITEDEFQAAKGGNFEYFVWIEPYGAAAVQAEGANGNLLVGRLLLTGAQARIHDPASGAGSLPVGVQADDKAVVFRVTVGNSVLQFIADEMTKNRTSPLLAPAKRHMEAATAMDRAADEGGFLSRLHREGANDQRDAAMYDYGHLVHADPHPSHSVGQTATQWVQEAWFLGGGQWDHKPVIYPVWGSRNRLGNSADIYDYDLWSNLHYGYIGAEIGFTADYLNESAAIAQIFDNLTGTDDVVDTQAVSAGWGLHALPPPVTWRQVLSIVLARPAWETRARARMAATPGPFDQLQNELNRFNRAGPLEQYDMLRRMFGG